MCSWIAFAAACFPFQAASLPRACPSNRCIPSFASQNWPKNASAARVAITFGQKSGLSSAFSFASFHSK